MHITRRTLLVTLAIAGLAWTFGTVASAFTSFTVPVGANPGASAIIPQTNELIVVNGEADASVIDSVTNAVSTVPAGLNPAFVVVNPVTGYAYISNSNSNTVTVFYGYGEGKKRKVVPVGTGPLRMAINPNTNRTYVANCCDNTVTVIDGDTNSTLNIPVGTRPIGIAVNPVTNRVYVANDWSNDITVIDGFTNQAIATIPVGEAPYSVAVNPLSNKVYVAVQGSGFYYAPGNVTVIDGATHETVEIPAGLQPVSLAINTATNKIYVAGGQSNGDVTVIDGATGETAHVAIPYGQRGFAALGSVAINEVTNKIYLTDFMSTNLIVIDGNTNEVSLRPVPLYSSFVTVNPVNNRVYVSNSNDATVTVVQE
jgi:YVTN family beta-propeller protein